MVFESVFIQTILRIPEVYSSEMLSIILISNIHTTTHIFLILLVYLHYTCTLWNTTGSEVLLIILGILLIQNGFISSTQVDFM